jgi:hypothetical protein
MLNDLIYICVATLLPLIPAFVIYKTLGRYAPTSARVRGTPGLFGFLKGLKVDLKGAGASYFLLVFIIFGYILTRPHPPQRAYYTVEGQVALSPKDTLDTSSLQIAVLPPQLDVTPSGVFKFDIVLPHASAPLPSLVVSYPGHYSASIELDRASRFSTPNVTIGGDRVSIGDPVTLSRRDEDEPPYRPVPPLPDDKVR